VKKGPLSAYVVVASIVFAVVAVLAHLSRLFFFDLPATQLLQSHRSGFLDIVMRDASWPGYAPQFMVMFGLVLAGFLILKLRLEALVMTVALLGVGAMGFALKPLVGRTRPPDSMVWVNDHLTQDPFTFTAGHAHTYVVVYGWIIFLALTRLPKGSVMRWLLVVASLAIMLMTGVSRVYLGDHWASDVLGGYLLGSIWLGLEILAYLYIQSRQRGRQRTRAPAAAAART
jgi:membrane-associated phospholipid phosphatase